MKARDYLHLWFDYGGVYCRMGDILQHLHTITTDERAIGLYVLALTRKQEGLTDAQLDALNLPTIEALA